ncbi:MAG: hypothetical protein ACE5J2_02165 [Nitrososphaerales archaeon]
MIILPSRQESRIDSLKRYPIKFYHAFALIGLNSGITELDKLLGFIPKGKVVFIKGSQSRKHILKSFCLRAISQYHNYCIFIDGGNSFDPYILSKLATVSKQNPKEVLSRVIISRAFTCHQLASLIVKETGKIVEAYTTNLVVVSDILYLFTDPESEIDKYETEMILPKMLKCLTNLAKQKDSIVIITSDNSSAWLSRMVESFSDIALVVNNDNGMISVSLNKHPFLPHASTTFTLELQPEKKIAKLESWMMING